MINTMEERDMLEDIGSNGGLDQAVEFGEERDNSLFNSETSRLTRPSEAVDLRE